MEAYALVTAARNEEEYIEKTLRSVTSQTVLPRKWIIVSDGSTDRTDELVQRYAGAFPFIQLVRTEGNQHRNFASKVFALNAGTRKLALEEFDFVGFLDADVSFAPGYFNDLFEKFRQDAVLGLAGGFISQERNGRFVFEKGNRTRSVGIVQTFRRECFKDIGGFLPIRYGSEDACAEIVSRMKGWRVQSFPDLEIRHHRPSGSAVGVLRYLYWQGFADYSLGCHPVFEIAKLALRIPYPPFFLGALVRLSGFIAASLSREKRMVSPEFVGFLRNEQMERLRLLLRGRFN